MRISSRTIFETGTSQLSTLQAQIAKTQMQLSTNKRMLSAADDPIASAQVLVLSQAQAVNEQLAVNRQNARHSLSEVELALGRTGSLIQDVHTLAVNAGNGTLSQSDRNMLAAELEGRLEDLLGVANSTDSSGGYLFAGFRTGSQPFTRDASGFTYHGDQGQRELQIGAARKVPVSTTGAEVFMSIPSADDPSAKQSMFDTISGLVATLRDTTTPPAAGVQGALRNLTGALDNVLAVRASVGARLKEIDTLDSAGEDIGVQYAARRSELEDLDLVKAISEFSQQQITLEAAQKSFKTMSSLSLFNYIG